MIDFQQNEGQEILSLPLWEGISDPQNALLSLLPEEKSYPKGARILTAGERCKKGGARLAGSAAIVKEDEGGNPATVAKLEKGSMFAEAFAFSGEPLAVSVYASSACRVLWLDGNKIAANGALAANALKIFSRKNIFLTERVEHLSKHTLRGKVLSYLTTVRRKTGKNTFSVPFNRQGLADYLGCDRSALSLVLSKLKAEGVLDWHKNTFRLLP